MRKLTILFLLFYSFTIAQNKQVLYGFLEIPQSLLLNPGGNVDYKWHFGIPVLSQIHASFGSSELSVNDLFADDGRPFNDKLRDAIFNQSSADFFAINQQLEIFSGGFAIGNNFEKNGYLSFGFYQETDVIIYFPRDLAIFAFEGNQSNINRVFDLGDLNLRGELISVFHVGYNRKVNKKFTYGFRSKIYSSVFSFNSTNNRGSFITRPSQDNFFDHIFDLDLELQTSGVLSLLEDENSDAIEDISILRQRLLFGGNLGLGFDVGFTYQFSDQLSVDGSFQDIGFISHSKDVENYAVNGNFVFDGINPLFPDRTDGDSADDFVDGVVEDFDNLFELDTTSTNFITLRPIKFNSSVNYAFGKKLGDECNCYNNDEGYLNALGVQLYGIARPVRPQFALTAYYYRRLFEGLRAKATYTIDSFSFSNLGLGISSHIGSFNFYIIADNLLAYQNLARAQSVSLQFGFNLIFNHNEN